MEQYLKENCCCFTGHRPETIPYINDTDSDQYFHLEKVIRQEVHRYINAGYNTFYCGAARGAAGRSDGQPKGQALLPGRPAGRRGVCRCRDGQKRVFVPFSKKNIAIFQALDYNAPIALLLEERL